jgi:uncharacterized membrane protein
MTTSINSLVDRYLSAVAQATADLPAHIREDLLTDLREHIHAARADLSPETEAGVRTILDRLGDPASIAAAARQDQPPPQLTPVPAASVPAVPHRSRSWIWVVAALVLGVPLAVCVAGALLFFPARSTFEHGPVPVSVSPPPPLPSPARS